VTYLWDTDTGKDTVHLRRHSDRVTCVRFSPDGKQIVTGSWDNTARIWDVATGKQLQVLKGHECSIRAVAFTPDGKQVLTLSTAKKDSSIFFSNPGKEAAGPPAWVDPGPQTRVGRFGGNQSVYFSLNLGGEDKLAILWDAATGKEVAAFR